MEELKKLRKTRSDKGSIIVTERDQYMIAWIGEQWAARFDQIQKLLGKFPDPAKPFKNGEYPAATTVRDQLGRWQSVGWIGYERSLVAGNSWAWVTRKGLRFVDLDEIYAARRPADTRLNHIFAVNQIRMSLQKRYTWMSVKWTHLSRFRWRNQPACEKLKSKKRESKKESDLNKGDDHVPQSRSHGTSAGRNGPFGTQSVPQRQSLYLDE